jgi:amino acid adenylation domain-containing protein
MKKNSNTLTGKILDAFTKHEVRYALCIDGTYYKYSEVERYSLLIAKLIQCVNVTDCSFVGIFCYRSIHAYSGIFGTLLSGKAYMPLSPSFPTNRLQAMLSRSSCKVLVLSEECANAFYELAMVTQGLTVICPEPGDRITQLSKSLTNHAFVFPDEITPDFVENFCSKVSPSDPAYLLFTSGSTGVPKGVVVSHKNVISYLSYTIRRYRVTNNDRISQMFDITFDLSVHDIFVSLLSGACLFIVPGSTLMAPAKFIKEKEITLWFSVPSVAMFLEKMRMLKPGSFPSLRYSLFCGEALPQRSAEAWQAASPNSVVENLYGPTEATIAITNYTWNPATSPDECVNGLVPIGWPFDVHQVRIIKASNDTTLEKGELCLTGPQLTAGYLNAPEQTSEQFVTFDDSHLVWYKTGDIVEQINSDCLVYLGRMDDQLQVRGYRVELQEVDIAIRQAAGTDLAVCVPMLLAPGQADSLIAVIQGQSFDLLTQKIIEHCRQLLPDYMVPSKVKFVDSMPLNANGKIDRQSLIEREIK